MLRRATAIAACAVLALTACSGDDSAGTSTTAGDGSTTTEVLEPLRVLVTNDDGIGAIGIDALVRALDRLPDVEVVVVAPAENQSGSADKTTAGGAAYGDGETRGGVAGTAVEGYPADAIAVALDDLGFEPHVVVSGINSGQNVGPLAYVSGTVGAGRVANRRGIPAVAGSAGLTEDTPEDYELAAELIVAHLEERREGYVRGEVPADAVVNINVPDCTAGEAKDLLEVALATELPEGVNPFAADCSGPDGEEPTDDVRAVAAGYPALSLVPDDVPSGP